MIGAAVQPDIDPGARSGVIGDVGAGAADQPVGPAAARQPVVPRATRQRVRARIAAQHVVERRPDQRFDTAQRIALRIAAAPGRAVQRDRHPAGGGRVIGGVVARAADQHIGARPARQPVVGRITRQHVIARRPAQILDPGQPVTLGVAAAADARRQVHRHRRGRGAVIGHVAARATVQRVGAAAPRQHVVAGPAGQHIVGGVTDQQVVEAAAQHPLDRHQMVAGRVAGRFAPVQIDLDTRGRVRIIGGVEARATVQRVRAQSADQQVVARPAAQRVIAAAAGQHVGEGRAAQFLDSRQPVALGIAAAPRLTVEPDGDAGGGRGIVRGVAAAPAVQHVRPAAADQRVVARPATQYVRPAIAGQRVVERRSGQVLDAGQHIALRIAAAARRAVQSDGHRRARPGIVRHVDAVAAVQPVRTAAADQYVVACAAAQPVVALVADQRVVERGAFQLLDRGQPVARRIPGHRRSVQRRAHPRARPGVAGNVEALAAIQHIGATRALQHVIARTAGQHIGGRIADQPVVEGRSGQPLDPDIGIALRIAARALAAVEIDGHADLAVGEGRAVDTGAAVDPVGPGAAGQHIVLIVADQRVVERRSDQILYPRQRVALRVGTGARGPVQIGGDRRRRRGIAGGVSPFAALQHVRAAAADQQVVALAAIQRVRRRRAVQRVVAIRTEDVLDIGQLVALGVAAMRYRAVQMDLDALQRILRRALLAQEGRGIGNRVAPRAAVDRVRARAAVDDIVAVVAGQRVVERRSGQILDTGIGIALGIAALARARLQVRGNRDVGHFVADRVGPAAALDLVGAGTRDHHVVAITGVDDIARRVGKQHVDRRTGDRIGRLHVRVAGDHLDAEARGYLDGIGIIGAVGRQPQVDGQKEFGLEAVRRRGLARIRQRIGQLDVEAEMRLARRIGHQDAVGIGIAGDDLDIALLGRDDPALVGQLRIFDRIAFGQRRHEHLEQRDALGRHHRADVQRAQRRARRRLRGAVGIDAVGAAGAGDRLARGLCGIVDAGRRTGAAGRSGDDVDLALGGGLDAFLVEQLEIQRGHQLAQPDARTRSVVLAVGRGRRTGRRRRAGRRRGGSERITELLGQPLALFVGRVPLVLLLLLRFLRLGGVLRLDLGRLGLLLGCFLRRLVRDFRRQVQLEQLALFLDLADRADQVGRGEALVEEIDRDRLTRKGCQRHARNDDAAAVGEDQHDVDVDDLRLERRIRDVELGVSVRSERDDL